MKTKVTVTPADQKEQDIFTPGNLVFGNDLIVIVSTASPISSKYFAGTALNQKIWGIGHYRTDWIKKSFTQFHGTITLTTE